MRNNLTVIIPELSDESISKKPTLKNEPRTLRPRKKDKNPRRSDISNYPKQKRTRCTTNAKESIQTTISSTQLTKQDTVDQFHAKPSRLHASITATGNKWKPKIVSIDPKEISNLIYTELTMPQWWKSQIQPCRHPRYTGATGHQMRFHYVIPLYV